MMKKFSYFFIDSRGAVHSIGGYVIFWYGVPFGQSNIFEGLSHGTVFGLCCAIAWHIAEAQGWKEKM